MSEENLIGVDPLDWMNKSEVEDVKKELSSENASNNEESSEETYSLKLDKNFDIRNLDAAYKDINEKFKNLKNIHIDVSQVSKLDAASIQFLTSLKKTADDKLIDIQFLNGNDYFKQSVNLMGLDNTFN